MENDKEEWRNLANDPKFESIKVQLTGHIPENPIPLPEASLIDLQEHHIPPVKSKTFYESKERIEWMKRFDN